MKQTACLWTAEPISETSWEEVLDHLELYTPQLELEAPGTVYLEAAGMEKLYGDWAAWSEAVLAAASQGGAAGARLGIAEGYLASRLAAEYGPAEAPWQRVSEPDRAYLARFPLDVIPLAKEPRRRMELLGISTLGQLARLSTRAVSEQFGAAVLPLYQLACGAKGAPRALRQMHQVTAGCAFDPATANHQEILAALLALSQPLWESLRREGRTVRRVALRASGWHWQDEQCCEVLAALTGEPDLRGTLLTLLARIKLRGPVEDAGITLQGVLPLAIRQPMLWTTKDATSELDALAQRLSRRCPAGILRGEQGKSWAPLASEHYGLAPWSSL